MIRVLKSINIIVSNRKEGTKNEIKRIRKLNQTITRKRTNKRSRQFKNLIIFIKLTKGTNYEQNY